MAKTVVINIRNMQHGDVYIGRAGKGNDGYFGNPFSMSHECERDAVVARYRAWFEKRINEDPVFKQRIEALKGHRLVCFCAPKACHGDIIAEYLNRE